MSDAKIFRFVPFFLVLFQEHVHVFIDNAVLIIGAEQYNCLLELGLEIWGAFAIIFHTGIL